jgi:hypothetical protein
VATLRARVRELEASAKVLLGDIDHCGQWVAPTPALERMRATLAESQPPAPTPDINLSNCQLCGEFRGHGHECRTATPPPPSKEGQP